MLEALFALSNNPLSIALATSSWVIPTMQSLHILSIGVLFMSILLIALRTLGLAWTSQTLLQTVDRFAPWAWGALVTLAITGIILVFAEPTRELTALSFYIKMALLLVAGVISARFVHTVRRHTVNDVQPTPRLYVQTVGTLLMWVAIIFMGRFIAYDALLWGSLSAAAHL